MAQGTVKFVIQTTASTVQIQAYGNALQQLGPTAQNASNKTTSAFNRVEATLNKMKSAVIGFIGAFVFMKAIRGLGEIIEAGVSFEATFSGIRKTVEGTAEDFAKLSDQMRQLAKEIPIGVNELNKIGEIAGSLGIPTNNIAKFVSTIAKVGTATNLSVEDAATGFARFANIMQMPIDKINQFASVVVHLGNKFPATETEILDFSLNIAAAGKQVGLSADEIAALSTALASVGLHSEKAGSAMSRIMIEMLKATETGGKELETFAKVAKVSTEKFAEGFRNDAAGSLMQFLAGLNEISDKGGSVIKTLEDLHLSEIRVRDVTLRAKEAISVFRDALNEAGLESARNGKALENEFTKKLESARAQLDLAWARIHDVAIELSGQLIPALVTSAKAMANFVEGSRDFVRENDNLIKVLLGIGAVFAALKLLAWIAAFKAVGTAIAGLQLAFGSLAGSIYIAQLSMAALAPFLAPALFIGAAMGIAHMRDEFENLARAREQEHNAYNKYFQTLSKKHQELIKFGFTEEDIRTRTLVSLQNEMEARKHFDKTVAEVTKRKIEREKVLSEEEEKRIERIKGIKDAVTQASKSDEEWLAAIRQLMAAHVPMNAIIDEFGGRIEDTIERQRMLGKAVDPVLTQLGKELEAQKQLTRAFEDAGKMLDYIMQKREEYVFNEIRLRNELSKHPGTGFIDTEIVTGRLTPAIKTRFDGKPSVEQMDDAFQATADAQIKAEKAAKAAAEAMERGMARAIDNIFEKLVRDGTLAWKDVARFASELFEPLAAAMFRPMQDLLLTPLQKGMNALDGQVQKLFSGKDGKGLFGMGDKLSGLLGSAASAGIGAAVSIGINMIAGLFKKSGSEVNNNLVKDIQNPFTDAVGKLMESFYELNTAGKITLQKAVETRGTLSTMWAKLSADAAAYAALGPKQSDAVAGMFETFEQYFGTELSTLFGDIDNVIVSLGGTTGMTTQELETMTEAMERLRQFTESVKQTVDSVTANAANVEVMTAALDELKLAGIPAELIIGKLGDSIVEMAKELRILGRDVPEVIAEFERLTIAAREAAEAEKKAADELERMTKRLPEVEQELIQVGEAIENAFIRKLEYLESEIGKARTKIEGWKDDISKLNEKIAESGQKLADAEHWQKRYNDIIGEAEDALKKATKERESIQEEIVSLTKKVEEDRLNAIIKNSKNATMVKLAEMALEKLAQQEIVDRIARLEELKRKLPDAIRLEKEAITLLGQKHQLAAATVQKEKEQLVASVLRMIGERTELEKNIALQEKHIELLDKERKATETTMNALGIARLTELQLMDATIKTLGLRKAALEAEDRALRTLLNLPPRTGDTGGTGGTGTGGTGTGDTGGPPPSGRDLINFPGTNIPRTTLDGFPVTLGANRDAAHGYYIDTPFGMMMKKLDDPSGFYDDYAARGALNSILASFHTGTDYVPRTGPYMLERGEAVVSAKNNRERGTGGVQVNIREMHISGASGMQSGRDAAEAFVRRLETDGGLAARLAKAVKERQH